MFNAIVIGLGKIGMLYDLEQQRPHPSTHVYAYESNPDYKLICGIDGDLSKKKVLDKMSQDALFYESIDIPLNNKMFKDIDVVSICTPPDTHLDIIKKLIKNNVEGIIFCEKPIVCNEKEVDILLDMVNNENVTIIPNISRRWNNGLRSVSKTIQSKKYGQIEKINIRYTRGIYNTGTHLFDLLKMWTGQSICKVMTLSETSTSSLPEKSFSFWFEQEDGVTGYAEAINDENYYQFDVDIYCSNGKIEMRNSGDDIRYYKTSEHHLFSGLGELALDLSLTNQLNDMCIRNAIDNIKNVLEGKEEPYCKLTDAIYPLYVANAVEESYKNKAFTEVKNI